MVWRRRQPRPPPRAAAVVNTASILHVLLDQWLHLPTALEELVLAAVMEARWSRACELKRHLAVVQAMPTDLDHFFTRVVTPAFLVQLLADLEAEQLLSHPQRIHAEECVLGQVSREGTWRNDTGPQATSRKDDP
jgi:hypothetical protein